MNDEKRTDYKTSTPEVLYEARKIVIKIMNVEYARNALRARCSLPDKKESNPAVNSGCLSRGFPELAGEINFEEVV